MTLLLGFYSFVKGEAIQHELGVKHVAVKYEHDNKRTTLTKYDSVPFVPTKELFKRTGSFVNVTSSAKSLGVF